MFPGVQFIGSIVESVVGQFNQQQQMTTNVMQQIQGFVPMVQNAWKGDDANEFAADVQRKLLPAIAQLIAAIAGMSVNLNKATDVMNTADSKVKGLADGLGDVFSKI